MSTYTKGPWSITTYSNYFGWSIYGSPTGCIAERWYDIERSDEENAEMMANAILIAAAPELLEALKYMYDSARELSCDCFELGAMQAAKEAIAKAEVK